jgi:hypothetical protein
LGMFKDSAIILDAIRRLFLTKSATEEMFTSESILDGHHFYQLPSVTKSRIPPTNVWSVQSLIPINLCTNTSVFVADRPALKQNFVATPCSSPPSMTYKENWLYTVEDTQTKLGVWTDDGW